MERDKSGRFQKGVSGNPAGRKKRETELDYLQITLSVCTPDKFRSICAKAVDQAIRGDATARKWLSDYILGTPIQRTSNVDEEGNVIALKVVYEKVKNGA